jgi:hypothetical protein
VVVLVLMLVPVVAMSSGRGGVCNRDERGVA